LIAQRPGLQQTGPPRIGCGNLFRMRDTNPAVWIVPFALLVLTIVTVPVHLLDGLGLPRYRALRDELVKVLSKNERLEREVRELSEETERLRHDTRAIERIARDELGMVREGEIVLQFPN
jgi:cell division protein FtsB